MFFSPSAEALLSGHALEGMQHLQISLSTRGYEEFLPNVRLDLKGRTQLALAFGLKAQEARWDVWEEGEWAGGRFGLLAPKMFGPLWLFTHLCLKESFDPYKEKSLVPVSGQTAAGLQDESKGLQWLQASFRVLQGALESCQRNPEQVVVANFSLTPDGFSLQCFNLEMNLVFRPEGFMSVVVFDDKNQGAGSAKTPSLEADFATLKPAVIDEFIKLSALIMKAAESRYL